MISPTKFIEFDTIKVVEIVNFKDLLSPKAKELYETQKNSTELVIDREKKHCQYFCKQVQLTDDLILPNEYVVKMASIFNKLVDKDLIKYGCVSPAMVMRLADLRDKDGTIVYKNRAMLMLFVFSDFTYDQLNKELGDNAFVEEGNIGSDDWIALPNFLSSSTN